MLTNTGGEMSLSKRFGQTAENKHLLDKYESPEEIAKSKQMESYNRLGAQITPQLHSLPPFRFIQTLDTLR